MTKMSDLEKYSLDELVDIEYKKYCSSQFNACRDENGLLEVCVLTTVRGGCQ
jgi:hypothetical protein